MFTAILPEIDTVTIKKNCYQLITNYFKNICNYLTELRLENFVARVTFHVIGGLKVKTLTTD